MTNPTDQLRCPDCDQHNIQCSCQVEDHDPDGDCLQAVLELLPPRTGTLSEYGPEGDLVELFYPDRSSGRIYVDRASGDVFDVPTYVSYVEQMSELVGSGQAQPCVRHRRWPAATAPATAGAPSATAGAPADRAPRS